MDLLYEQHIQQSALVFGMLMACFVAISTTYIFGTLLTANGNLKELNIMAAGGMCINILLNLILIPKSKAFGAAVSSLITQFLTATIQVFIVQWIFKFRINYRLLLILLVFVLGVITINYISIQLSSSWMVNFVFMTSCSVVWAFITGLIRIKSLVRLLKYG